MTIRVDPDWWQTLFDEVYLITDARTVGNADITRREIDLYCRLLPFKPDDRILDLCGGQGRHALELCRRGYARCAVVDYSRPLLSIGQQTAWHEKLPVHFIQADARRPSLKAGSHDHVLILGNSLGYMAGAADDLRVLTACWRILTTGGWLLLDVTDGEAIRDQIAPNAWHEIDGDVVVCREREVRSECVCARELVLSKRKGLIRDKNYRIRLYRRDELVALAHQAGFSDVQVYDQKHIGAETGEDLGCMRQRLLITARRC